MNTEKHFSLLKIIEKNPEFGQRALAKATGLSLGMTNFLLKQFVEKGFVLIKKLDTRRFCYLLTPEGIKELSKRSYRYIKKTMKSIVDCRQRLERIVAIAQEKGYQGLVLVGESELDFMVEFLCQKHQLAFSSLQEEPSCCGEYFVLYSEIFPFKVPNIFDLCVS